MFASQLLRILQTIPSDVKYESCVYDPAEQDITMKENQNSTPYDSQSLGRSSDSLVFGGKELYIRDADPSVFDVKGRDECWKTKFADSFSMDKQNGDRDSREEEFPDRPLCRPSSFEEDGDSSSSEMNVKETVPDRPLCRPSSFEEDGDSSSSEMNVKETVEEFTRCHKDEYIDSRSPHITALDLFDTDTKLYADKNVLEYEAPEIIVCYKEINYHVVKDICIDQGMPLDGRSSTESSKEGHSGHSSSPPLDDDSHRQVTEGAADVELPLTSDGLATSPSDNTKVVSPKENGSKEESHGKLLAQEKTNLSSGNPFDKPCDPFDLMQEGETNSEATDKTSTDASEEDSFIDRTLPIQKFGTRSFLRSFINSLDSEDSKAAQMQDQISSGKAVSVSPSASSSEAGLKEDVQASSLYFNSKVENGSITFDFNSPAPLIAGNTYRSTESKEEHSVDSGDMLDHKNSDSDNLSDTSKVDLNGSKDTTSIVEIHEESPLNIKNDFPNDFSATSQAQFVSINNEISNDSSATSQAQSVSIKDMTDNNKVHDQFSDNKDEEPDGLSPDNLVLELASSKSNGNAVVSREKYDEGELSFSAAGLITYAGPVAYTGSLSLRSDGSATSGRSFAFPILQSEWGSSPVRMTKAEERHFRKHKGWRSGLFCCRF